jgi:UDP-N-acetyl-D-glucosamine dehydrogenase
VLDQVTQALNEHKKPLRDSKIAVLGVAYKKDIDDPRESPALVLLDLLHQRGAVVSYNDPHVPKIAARQNFRLPDLASSPLTAEFLAAQDCVLIVTDHTAYDGNFIVQHARLVVDTRNATRNVTNGREKIRRA